jgi:hypothetical protein
MIHFSIETSRTRFLIGEFSDRNESIIPIIIIMVESLPKTCYFNSMAGTETFKSRE